MKQRKVTRMSVLAGLWCKYGCPERMTIHVKRTGETITLLNGLPVTDNGKKSDLFERALEAQKRELRVRQPVTDNRVCERCKKAFFAVRQDSRFCSPRCRKASQREQDNLKRRHEAEQRLTRAWNEGSNAIP